MENIISANIGKPDGNGIYRFMEDFAAPFLAREG
jgi:hypothetical protein